MKYTFDDIIIDPKDSRLELGAKYYFSVSPNRVIKRANEGLEEFCTTLTAIVEDSDVPFIGIGGINGSCIIRKKEDEKRYMPYDFSDLKTRQDLLGASVRYKEPAGCVQDGLITAFLHDRDGIWRCSIGGKIDQTAERLMDYWTFWNGSPCGDEVTV